MLEKLLVKKKNQNDFLNHNHSDSTQRKNNLTSVFKAEQT